jgi:hypothetical protein
MLAVAAPFSEEPRKRFLSPSERRLVELMQRLNFGRIEGLTICSGEPVFDPPPRVVRLLKMGGDNNPRPQLRSVDFGLKHEVAEALEHLRRLEDGVVQCIEVRHGLPFSMEIEGEPRA